MARTVAPTAVAGPQRLRPARDRPLRPTASERITTSSYRTTPLQAYVLTRLASSAGIAGNDRSGPLGPREPQPGSASSACLPVRCLYSLTAHTGQAAKSSASFTPGAINSSAFWSTASAGRRDCVLYNTANCTRAVLPRPLKTRHRGILTILDKAGLGITSFTRPDPAATRIERRRVPSDPTLAVPERAPPRSELRAGAHRHG